MTNVTNALPLNERSSGGAASRHKLMTAVADEMKGDDVLEGRLNGDKDTLDEMDESRKEDKNGFKAKFMFNIADGGFTGESEAAGRL